MLSEVQFMALRAVEKSGGSAVLDRYNRIVAAGEVLSYHPATILRLCMSGLMDACDGHVYVSPAGRAALEQDDG